jgi:hypothetical protein
LAVAAIVLGLVLVVAGGSAGHLKIPGYHNATCPTCGRHWRANFQRSAGMRRAVGAECPYCHDYGTERTFCDEDHRKKPTVIILPDYDD